MYSPMKLIVRILEGEDLPAADIEGTSDPYVVFRVGNFPEDRTAVKMRTLDPVWNETFSYENVRRGMHIRFEVYDHDQVGDDDMIGMREINLADIPNSMDNTPVLLRLDLMGEDKNGTWVPSASLGKECLLLVEVTCIPAPKKSVEDFVLLSSEESAELLRCYTTYITKEGKLDSVGVVKHVLSGAGFTPEDVQDDLVTELLKVSLYGLQYDDFISVAARAKRVETIRKANSKAAGIKPSVVDGESEQDLLQAWVALGGNQDKTGQIGLKELQQYSLDFEVDVTQLLTANETLETEKPVIYHGDLPPPDDNTIGFDDFVSALHQQDDKVPAIGRKNTSAFFDLAQVVLAQRVANAMKMKIRLRDGREVTAVVVPNVSPIDGGARKKITKKEPKVHQTRTTRMRGPQDGSHQFKRAKRGFTAMCVANPLVQIKPSIEHIRSLPAVADPNAAPLPPVTLKGVAKKYSVSAAFANLLTGAPPADKRNNRSVTPSNITSAPSLSSVDLGMSASPSIATTTGGFWSKFSKAPTLTKLPALA